VLPGTSDELAKIRTRIYVYFYSSCHLHQGGGYAISAVCLSVILFVCVNDYYKCNRPISLKHGVMNGPTSRKKWLTVGDVVLDTDSRSLFHFLSIVLWEFYEIYYRFSYNHRPIFMTLSEMTDVNKVMNPDPNLN